MDITYDEHFTREDARRAAAAELPVIQAGTGKPFLYIGDAAPIDGSGEKIAVFRDAETGELHFVPRGHDSMRYFESVKG